MAALAAVLLLARPVAAHKKEAVALGPERRHPSGAFSYQIPEGWSVAPTTDDPDATDVLGPDGAKVRFVYHRGEIGYDALHALCVMQRFSGSEGADPAPQYEYDYEEGRIGARRTLDSLFQLEYPEPLKGYRKWRQRNLTIVGGGLSLCVISYVPVPVWKKSEKVRDGVAAVFASVKFRE